MFMLDTDICIYAINKRPKKLKTKFDAHYGHLSISTVTLAELMYGVQKSSNPESNLQNVLEFCKYVNILFFDDAAAIEYGKIRAELERSGRRIGQNDTLIAAHTRSVDATLVTNNTGEFKRVQDLKVEKWI